VLFTTEDSDVMSVNQLLRKSGFSNLAKIDRIVHLAVIPQTATGKVAFRQLEKLLQEGKPA
jgi:non-ribosomal peptide synthetase component E (peptide arylation enzyme)